MTPHRRPERAISGEECTAATIQKFKYDALPSVKFAAFDFFDIARRADEIAGRDDDVCQFCEANKATGPPDRLVNGTVPPAVPSWSRASSRAGPAGRFVED